MTVLLEIKEKLKSIYAEYAYIIILVLKFLLALIVFLSLNHTMGFWEPLKTIFLILILSLLCSLLSVKAIGIFAGMLIVGHSYALGLEVLGVTAALFLLLFLFFLRFDEKDGLALLLTPLALSAGIPVCVPICYGLKGKPASAVSIASGTIVHFYMHMLSEKASLLQNVDKSDLFASMLTNLRILIDGFLKNRLMFLTLAALVLVLCVVYVVRRLGLDYIWHIAIGTGAVVYLITMISGGLFLDIDISAGLVVLGTLVSVLIALVMEFFVLSVDYSRAERMEFEDDEYYYYVRAVPKMTISKSQREIKTISSEMEAVGDDEKMAAAINEDIDNEDIDVEGLEGEDAEVEEVEPQPSKWKVFIETKMKPGLLRLMEVVQTKVKPKLLQLKDFTKKKIKQVQLWLKKLLEKE